ncbi:MAG: hypothetical protein ABIK09_16325 [Pseudomonadota bacterium]
MKILRLVVVGLSLVLSTTCIQEAKWTWTGDTDTLADGVAGDGKGDVGIPDVQGGETPRLKDTTDTTVRSDTPPGTELPLETVDPCGDGDCQEADGENCQTCPVDCCPSACGDGVCQKDECGESISTCPADCCICGDKACNVGPPCNETQGNCQADCCVCGDGQCSGVNCNENLEGCPVDCSVCGDDHCTGLESVEPDNPHVCMMDCCGSCGDKICKGGECHEDDPGHPKYCDKDCEFACGNQDCEPGENPFSCPQDCEDKACGNNLCEPGEGYGSAVLCPDDCGANCGDCLCDGDESNMTCPQDCGYCGDGTCSSACPEMNESVETCPQDCCNDGNPCTEDVATAVGDSFLCDHVPDDLAGCEEFLKCTTGDLCQGGACKPGEGTVACDDGNPCTDDSCEGAVGGCVFLLNADPCEDGDPCTSNDTCSEGVCLSGGPTDCDDGNPCTNDVCVSEGSFGCAHANQDNGVACLMDCGGPQATCQEGLCTCP